MNAGAGYCVARHPLILAGPWGSFQVMSLALRVVVFFAVSALTVALLAVPYLQIQ
jgi:hypothetical protein